MDGGISIIRYSRASHGLCSVACGRDSWSRLISECILCTPERAETARVALQRDSQKANGIAFVRGSYYGLSPVQRSVKHLADEY